MAIGKRSSSLSDARYIKPEQIRLGDLIRVSYKENEDTGITKTEVGKVARREYRGVVRVFLTAQGAELLEWVPGYASPTITLLDRPAVETAMALPGMENETVWSF